MSQPIFTVPATAQTLVAIRTCTRQVGQLVGLDHMQQTRFSTAVSEIARNAVQHGLGGSLTFLVRETRSGPGQSLVAQVTDQGPGIPDLEAVLQGMPAANGRLPMGIIGSKRLVDQLIIEAPAAGGTLVRIEMALPRNAPRLGPADLARLADQLARRRPQSPMEEVELQNRELLKTHQALRDKQAELEQADERKNQFVATLAHELRNPLSTLAMMLEVLRRKPVQEPEELARRVAVMTRQTTQLTQLVDDLLDIARVSQGKVELRLETVDFNILATQALEMTGGAIAAKDHAVTMDLHPAPLWVKADAGRIKQVICNLVQNSARYTPPRGAIAVRVGRDADWGFVEVADNGSGIAADVLPHIFGLFVQGDATRASGEGGLGVGLSLVRRLVQDHGGTVAAASEGAGRGSRFTVALPLVATPA
ncbi:MAG: hypothetical protein JWQ76_1037 [Ramlibacter sp.]|nr:hypothetical protein [Ramlibacter sp.]